MFTAGNTSVWGEDLSLFVATRTPNSRSQICDIKVKIGCTFLWSMCSPDSVRILIFTKVNIDKVQHPKFGKKADIMENLTAILASVNYGGIQGRLNEFRSQRLGAIRDRDLTEAGNIQWLRPVRERYLLSQGGSKDWKLLEFGAPKGRDLPNAGTCHRPGAVKDRVLPEGKIWKRPSPAIGREM
ncbi:hypothetical protein J6590_067166 [Homalodisca vitripennis]|nr:hypothetical protein J6590_067166 [Homalodisca vitripennis]